LAFREYDEARDLKAIDRIWREIAWLDSPEQAPALKDFLSVGDCLTATIADEAECAVHIVPGSMRYLDESLEMCAVTAVTTSRLARKQGFARDLTALQLAKGASQGAEIASLGMFDQGYYDRLGFGTGSYEHTFVLDPATLLVDARFRPPVRLDKEAWRDVHAAMMGRMAGHGTCCLTPPEFIKGELGFQENGFGLGYYEGETLTHFFWAVPRGENGPYRITFIAYRNVGELMELLALIKSLGDQVSTVIMREPPHIQLQDLLREPFRNRRNTKASEYANEHRSLAYWQIRALDIAACVSKRRWNGPAVRFNLSLRDPLYELLEGEPWRGVGGDYVVHVGESSEAAPGQESGLPTLQAGVGAFTRMLFGIVSASKLAVTDELSGPAALLTQLDAAFVLPTARTTWDF